MTSPVQPLPSQLTIYVNFPCNLRCKNCYLFGVADYDREYMGPGTTQEMPWEVFTAAVDPIIASGRPASVCFMGGEPLLHPGLADFVAYIKRSPNIFVDINTNATISRKRIEALLAAQIDAVYVSLDGSTPEINDAGRGAKAFARAMRGLNYLLTRRAEHYPELKVAINHTITNVNYLDLVGMAELCARLGVDELFTNLPTFVRRSEGEAGQRALAQLGYKFESWRGFVIDEMVDGVDAKLFGAELQALSSRTWPFTLFIQPVKYEIADLPHWFTDHWPQTTRETSCPIQGFRTTVLPNGDVIPCTVYPDIVIGNLTEMPLDELWHGERYAKFREFVTSRLLATCLRCCDLYDEAGDDPLAFVKDTRVSHVRTATPSG